MNAVGGINGIFSMLPVGGAYPAFNFQTSLFAPQPKQQSAQSDAARSYMAAIKDYGSGLRSALSEISGAGRQIFNKLAGVSSNDGALSVGVKNQADAARFKNAGGAKTVTVGQLATSQQNAGASLSSVSPSGVGAGTNRFTIEKDGKVYSFSAEIKSTDSARTAQQKTADAINKQNSGVSASVQYDEKTKRSSLVITSKDTGAGGAFSVSDSSGGNLIQKLGAAAPTREAKDAVYFVNGTEKTSATNSVDFGDGLTGTLLKAGAGDINVSVKKDVAGIYDAVGEVVSKFNNLLGAAKSFGGDRGADSLRQRLDSISSSYEPSLNRIGITRNKDGNLDIDEKKLRKAFEDGSAERFLGNGSAGFISALEGVARRAETDPGQFLSRQRRDELTKSAAGPADMSDMYYRFMANREYSQLSNIGLLLNMEV
ncbi:MAG: flagellar filament capping protein FliD [Defluviitaleaceae bacterium]|nr:flagellar filament capping protein FliD [Defluviitaleaceae bacterium]